MPLRGGPLWLASRVIYFPCVPTRPASAWPYSTQTVFRLTNSFTPGRDLLNPCCHKISVSRAELTDLVSWHITESRLGVLMPASESSRP